ncbi:P2R1A-PPP2R2A-interacting phosphatase regulator 1-like isoform X2 [Ambystoma mexicanum]|uniref:P2R1A-PPP2R2A-interacting phosphatase regulator 1-like isoform X2 n=1 Tax=Ambystoma mexicanum TaxID=8296 RepID=UPI0037E740E6
MERMEVEQCAGAEGRAALRRSNSAPLISSLSESSVIFQACGSRCRRSSMSMNFGCPGLPLPVSPVRTHCLHCQTGTRQQAVFAGAQRRGTSQSSEAPPTLQPSTSWQTMYDLPRSPYSSGRNPTSSHLLTPFSNRTVVEFSLQPSALTSLKRKGDVEMDSPPNKLFVAGVSELGNLDQPILHSAESLGGSLRSSMLDQTLMSPSTGGQMLMGCSSHEFSPTPGSPAMATVFLQNSPTTNFIQPNSHAAGL